jgi:hypothetical protein
MRTYTERHGCDSHHSDRQRSDGREAPHLIAKSAYTRRLAVRVVTSEQFLFSPRSKITEMGNDN